MSGEKVCEARAGAWRAMSFGDRVAADLLLVEQPGNIALIIPCPPIGAPIPGCGAKVGEACREPGVDNAARARRFLSYLPIIVDDATPAVDVGAMREEIERLSEREAAAFALVRGLTILATSGRDQSHRANGLGATPCAPASMCDACRLIAHARLLAGGAT